MKARQILSILLIQVVGMLLISCAPMQKAPFNALDLNPKLQEGYVKKVDNFLVVLDASTSMYTDQNNKLGYPSKLEVAKDIVSNMNQTIPDLDLQAGMRVFGPYKSANMIYGMEKYSRDGLAKAVQMVKSTQGLSPLTRALDSGNVDIETVPGRTAVIVVSDGEPTDSDPIKSAKDMKDRYGDNLCLYTVQVGNSPTGKTLLNQIADAGACGFAVNADWLTTPASMADFVEKVFLKKGSVAKLKEKITIELRVQFDFDKSNVKPEYHDHIMKVANFLKAYPGTRADLEGHTCSIGTEAYNLGLSKRRAAGVKRYLVEKFGISASRISTKGYGESRPLTSNDTLPDRIKNRRVTANIVTITIK